MTGQVIVIGRHHRHVRGELFATLRPQGNGARRCCTRQELLLWQCRRAELRVLRPVGDTWRTSPTSEMADRRHGSPCGSWRYLPRALPWLWQFAKASRPYAVERSADALIALTRPLFENLMPLVAEARAERFIQRVGQLHVYSTEAAFQGDPLAMDLRQRRGVTFEVLAPEGNLSRRWPRSSRGPCGFQI